MAGGPWEGEEESRKLQGKGGGAEEGQAEAGGPTSSQRVLVPFLVLFLLSVTQWSAVRWSVEQWCKAQSNTVQKSFSCNNIILNGRDQRLFVKFHLWQKTLEKFWI